MSDELKAGDRVYNPRYGRGRVRSSERIDNYQKVVIQFDSGEEITVRDPRALHLERLEEAPPPDAGAAGGPAAPAEEEDMDRETMRSLLIEALEEVCGPAEAPLGERWRGGVLVLKPGKSETLAKEIPIEKFFQKIVRLRDQLRVLEQKINSNPALPSDEKIAMQHYITRCYGSLTTFNVLFKEADDRFVGAAGGDDTP